MKGLLVLLLLAAVILPVLYWSAAALHGRFNSTAERQREFTRMEQAELRQLRSMRHELVRRAHEAADVEPFALTVLDIIRSHDRQVDP